MSSRVQPVEDWPQSVALWRNELQQLVAAHLGGGAPLAFDEEACRYCHLPAFCRRRAVGDEMPEEGRR